jgi:spermidine/putrescine transport system permease protein
VGTATTPGLRPANRTNGRAATPPPPGPERDATRASARRGLLIALPPLVVMVVLFVVPLGIVAVYSFATRSRTGRTLLEGWNMRSYARLVEPLVLEVVARSIGYAALTTLVCLLIGYPFAYWLATRRRSIRYALLVLVMLPFWSNFLVRTYAWRVILASEGPLATALQALGFGEVRLLFTPFAVVLGLVYGFLPFMILPLYAAIERLDVRLVEAARDLGATGWEAFRYVTWPLSRPGVLAGSVLVFIPAVGAYVTPELLGGSRTTLLGTFIVRQFFSARDWPFGSALSMAILAIMLVATVLYFRSDGRRT